MLVTACLIIIAWTVEMPLWASVVITVFSALAFVCQLVGTLVKK